MQKVFRNLYIETYRNFDRDIDNELYNIIKNDIKYIVNLTECDQLNSYHRISLLCNKIKCKDLFNDRDLIRIKKIPPLDRSNDEINLRLKLREEIIEYNRDFIKSLCKFDGNILFLCNKNNVLSQLFTFIIMTIRKESHHIPIILKNRDIVTSLKNENDIKSYLDKYMSIIYNNINEVSK